jgi:hypothetical protein
MSTYVVTTDTVDVIVQAAIKYNVITRHSADVVGQAILAQNIRSVATRYPDVLVNGGMPGPLTLSGHVPHITNPLGYTFTPFERKLRRIAVNGAIRTWAYQCAEFEGHANTEISRLVALVNERNTNRLLINDPDFDPASDEAAEWGDVTDRDAVMLRVPQPIMVATPAYVEAEDLPEGDEDEDEDAIEDEDYEADNDPDEDDDVEDDDDI